MTPRFCGHCGQPVVPGTAFCGGCGHAIEPGAPADAPVHEALARLIAERGEGLLADADQFRGALDDHLDETVASAGTIYLLTDAVRLGAADALRGMIAAGAPPVDAVETAGARLARDRGSTKAGNATWACAALGYALGLVPAAVVDRFSSGPHEEYDEPAGPAPIVPPPPAAPAPAAPPPAAPPPAGPAPIAPAPPTLPAAFPVPAVPTPAYPQPAYQPPPDPVAALPVVVPVTLTPPPAGRGGRVGRVLLVGVIAVLVMFGVGSATAYLLTRDDDPPADRASDRSTDAERPTAPTDTGAGTPTATVTVTEGATGVSTDPTTDVAGTDPESALRDVIAADAVAADGLVGYWVPQLASISGDINGSWSAALAEYERLQGLFPDVLLLDVAEWPHAFSPSETYDDVFVVLSPHPASVTSAPVLDWCQLNRGDRQASCYAKLLETSGSPDDNTDQNRPEPEFN